MIAEFTSICGVASTIGAGISILGGGGGGGASTKEEAIEGLFSYNGGLFSYTVFSVS